MAAFLHCEKAVQFSPLRPLVRAFDPPAVDPEEHLRRVPHLPGHPARRDASHQADRRERVPRLPGIPIPQAAGRNGWLPPRV